MRAIKWIKMTLKRWFPVFSYISLHFTRSIFRPAPFPFRKLLFAFVYAKGCSSIASCFYRTVITTRMHGVHIPFSRFRFLHGVTAGKVLSKRDIGSLDDDGY